MCDPGITNEKKITQHTGLDIKKRMRSEFKKHCVYLVLKSVKESG